jgi:hypothetical protein
MAKKLIKFYFKNTGNNQAFSFDIEQNLAEIRTYLSNLKPPLMSSQDGFWLDKDTTIEFSQESEVTLQEVLSDDNQKVIIGVSNLVEDIDPNDGVQRYNLLTEKQKRGIFKNIDLLHGLCFSAEGFKKSFDDVFEFNTGTMPKANQPSVVTQKSSHTHFSKAVHELTLTSSESVSANLDTPYVSAEAEYKNEQSKTTTSTEITQYMTERFLVNKVDLKIELSQIKVNTDFVEAVRTAMKDSRDNEWAAFNKLIGVLNKWGYYIPTEFSLGGVLYATETAKIKEFSQAEKESEEFGGKFSAKFGSVGGGAAYSKAEGKEHKHSSETKYTNINLLQIGGDPFDTRSETYEGWFKSLEKAISWGITKTDKTLPTLYLLTQTEDEILLGRCIKLINNFLTKSSGLQPYLSLRKYTATISDLINSFD